MNNPVYIVDGRRTPFLKMRGTPGAWSASDLAVTAAREVLASLPFAANQLDEVVLGCMIPSAEEANIARVVSLRAGCGKAVPAFTVQRNCASGLQAIDAAFRNIATGRQQLVLAGGTEAMSRAPLQFNKKMVRWLAGLSGAKTLTAKLQKISEFRPGFLSPVISLLKGLTDHTIGLNMGQTAEIVAHRFGITRAAMDAYALESHQRVATAIENKTLYGVTSLFSEQGTFATEDDGVRRDTTLEKLGKLKPFFDKKFGDVTAGNSSQVTDGAALLVLASQTAVDKYQLPVLARIVDVAWAGNDPAEMGLGPVHAVAKLLRQTNKKLADIDYWELNEAFAAQVLGCLLAFDSETYCREFLGLSAALGEIDPAKLNIDGGAIALGHPVGASGARISLQLAKILQRNQAHYGIATLCIGGGQGGAILLENTGGRA